MPFKLAVIIVAISIHVPLTGDDMHSKVATNMAGLFQSTSPSRGTTNHRRNFTKLGDISIHVPLTGDDEGGTSPFS